MWRNRRSLVLAALLLLVSLGAVTVEAAFVHTDDGCAIEIHCLACRWAHGATVVPALVPVLCAPLLRVAVVPTRAERATTVETAAEAPARAPPLA